MSDKVGRFWLPVKSANKICRMSCKNRPTFWISVTMVIVYSGMWIFILVIYLSEVYSWSYLISYEVANDKIGRVSCFSAGARELEPRPLPGPQYNCEASCGYITGVRRAKPPPWSWELFSFGMSNESGKICRIDCIWLTVLCVFMNRIQWRSQDFVLGGSWKHEAP